VQMVRIASGNLVYNVPASKLVDKTGIEMNVFTTVIIEGKRCAIYSAPEVIGTKAKECRIVVVKAPRDDWADFQVYLTKMGITYVVPRGHIPKTTTLSLNSPVLVHYANAWDLLARSG